jgi:hypothetical protein
VDFIDSNDIQASLEMKARIARPVTGTLRLQITEHEGLTGDSGETREGYIDLDTRISQNLTLTTGLRIRESDFVFKNTDISKSLTLSGRARKNLVARVSYEGREQRGSELSGTSVLSGDLEYSLSPGISLTGQVLERKETSRADFSEKEAGLILNYRLNDNFSLSAQVKRMVQQGTNSSDYDGFIRYFKATGRF